MFTHLGTKLAERLARGDTGINGLDNACKDHDIAYSVHKDSSERYKADKKLSTEALKRVIAPDSSIGERAAALAVSAAMKAKTTLTKFGSGICRKKTKSTKCKTKKRSSIALESLIKNARAAIKKSKPKTINEAIDTALKSVKKSHNGCKITPKRIIQVPKSGGVLPLLPILVGLSAIGSIGSSAFNIVKSLKEIKNAESRGVTSPIKVGKGVYLAPYKTGNGLYLSPYKASGKGLYLGPYSKN